MSQPQKKKSSRKGGTKTDSAKSKQGVGMSTRASEEKSKSSEPDKVEGAKPMSSTSKSSVKSGSAATQKSTDSCKSKTKSGSSVLPGAAGGVKQQQPQTTATSQSKMGQLFGKTSNLDTKENQDRTHPEKLTGTSLHKNNDSKIQDGKPMLSAMEQLMEPFPSQGPDAPIPKCTGPAAKDEDPFDLLAGTLPSEEPDKSIPEYTGPKVKESDLTKEKGERVGERDDTIPPDYRFTEQPDPKNKDKPASSSTGPGTKLKTTEKTMTKDDVLESLAADFGEISADPLSKSSAATSHSAPPPSTMKQAPLQASTAATVSTSQTGAKDKDPFDLLADTLQSEEPDTSRPTYTGPAVKESDVTKEHIDRMGERDDTLPPDYRFKEQPAPKDKGPLASSTDAGTKPKIMTEGDVLESLSADFGQSSPASISKCSAAIPHFAEPPSLKQQPPLQASKAASVSTSQTGKKAPDKDALSKAPLQASKATTVSASQPGPKAPDKDALSKAPLQASKATTVSASQPGPKDNDAFDLLAQTLPSEAPDDSAPKYTGPPVKEADTTKKLMERMGERDETIPPDYRFKEQPDPKGKGQLPSSASPAVKPKTMTDADVLESLSADFVPSLPATIPKCSAAVSHSAVPPSLKQQAPDKDSLSKAPLQASKAATVSASQPGSKPSLQASKAASFSTSQTGKKAPDKDSLSKAPLQASKAATVSASQPGPGGKDPFDLLAATLPSEAPDDSAPKYTGPEVKESDATKKKGVRVGEWESTIPPDYRYIEQPGPKDKLAPSHTGTGTGAKPKTMTEGDVMDYMSADIIQSSASPISKCSAANIHATAPPSMQIEAPCQASKGAPVSASQTGAKLSEKGKDPFDLLAETLPSEAPDDSSPKFTGLAVKESDVTKKKGERVGEHESTIPPDYRFKEQPDPKDKGKLAPSFTDPGAKPKVMTNDDILDSLSGDFVQSSAAPISKCSAATPQFAALPSKQKEVMTDDDLLSSLSGDFVQSSVAPISKCSVATPQFAALPSKQKEDKDPFDLLAETLPSEASDNSAPKFSGPEVKEPDAKAKSIERMGERESTIPPEYRYGKQPDSKDKGKPTSSVTSPGAKPKTMTEDDVLTSLSADLVQSSAAQVSKCSAPVSHVAAPHSKQKQEPLKASTASSVSATQSAPKGKDPFDLLAKTLPSEAPDKSAPIYTGHAVKESDSSKKKAELVGETEESIPPEYRFTAPADPKDKGKSKMPSSSTGAGTKPKAMTDGDVLKTLSADFVESSVAPVSKCSAPVSHTVAPPSLQKQAPLQASTAASVSSSQSSTKDVDPFDLLAGTLPSEAPDTSGPKYTGPPVKESDANKKKAERVGEIEESIPPDYRFTEQTDPKDKGKPASSFAAPGAKPKLMTKEELVDNLSSDFDSSSSASHSVAPVSKQKESNEKPAAKPDSKKARKC